MYTEIETIAIQRNPKKRNQREKRGSHTYGYSPAQKRLEETEEALYPSSRQILSSSSLFSLSLSGSNPHKEFEEKSLGNAWKRFKRLGYERDGWLFYEKERSDSSNINK